MYVLLNYRTGLNCILPPTLAFEVFAACVEDRLITPPPFERYGVALKAFAARRVDISHTHGVGSNTKIALKVKGQCQM